jgi:membrane fusion protein, multidrug efflux system
MPTRRVLLGLLIVGAGATYLGIQAGLLPSRTQTRARDVPPPVPVMAGTVERIDFPVFLEGIGSVQAFNSVLVKSRVDGQIVKINFSEGTEVGTGDVLVEIDPAPFEAALAQAKATKAKDEAQLNNARLDFNRFNQLASSGAGTRQNLDTSRALVAQLEATVAADQAMIDMAQNQLNYTKIRSPIDGRTGTRLVDIGNIVRTTDSGGIVSINQLRPIFVTFALPADSLPQIRAKNDDKIGVVAQDANGRELAHGTLAVIDNQINQATGTINYKAVFDNQDQVLWPGQFVNVRVQIDIRRNATAVPGTAVQQGPEGPYCFVIGQDRRVVKRPVKIAIANKMTSVIEEGLEPGELVVTEGQYRLQAGSTVEVRPTPVDSSR